MKKYLMLGVAALALASCNKNDFTPMTQSERVQSQYNQAFVNTFGQPAANQTWGFGGVTRAANVNKNQWGNPNYGNWQIPPALSEGQMKRVKAYFQQNPNLTWKAPTYTNYFVQQVYKGGIDANEAFSKEYYYAANTDTVDASGHMDLLTVGDEPSHVNNFNYGTYNGGNKHKVLNTGATDENDPANFHEDMITLMEGPVPTHVGFHDSYGDVHHNDHAALVSAATIDAWAEEHRDELGDDYGEAVVDGWDRDFVGLDYESKTSDQVYVKNNGVQVYATIGDYDMGKTYVWDGKNFYKMSDVRNNPLKTPSGNKFPVVSTNGNQYLGQRVSIDQNALVTEFSGEQIMELTGETSVDGDNSKTRMHQVLDLTKIFNLVGTGETAAIQNAKGHFVKDLGGRDYVFSDWIVTLTPAKKQTGNTQITYTGRIMAEDLSANQSSDFDFNDVVFDWAIGNGKAYIKLLAAGGTLPLKIGGELNADKTEVIGGFEVHDKFGLTTTSVMVNTASDGAPKIVERPAVEFEIEGNFAADGSDIPVYVKKNGEWIELTAYMGEPAAKFNCPVGTKWVDEYVGISNAYPSFQGWVSNTAVNWTTNVVDKYVDLILSNNAE